MKGKEVGTTDVADFTEGGGRWGKAAPKAFGLRYPESFRGAPCYPRRRKVRGQREMGRKNGSEEGKMMKIKNSRTEPFEANASQMWQGGEPTPFWLKKYVT